MEIKDLNNPQITYKDGSLDKVVAAIVLEHKNIPIVVNLAYLPEIMTASSSILKGKQNTLFQTLTLKEAYEAMCLCITWLAKETGCTIWMDDGIRDDLKSDIMSVLFAPLSKSIH